MMMKNSRIIVPVAVAVLASAAMLVALLAPSPSGSLAQDAAAPATGRIEGTISVDDSDLLTEVVVYVEGSDLPRTVPKTNPLMVQRDKTFTPSMIPVVKGTTVEFPNDDKVFHNVFSRSKPAIFDLGLYKAGSSKSVTFDEPGAVNVFCNIHPDMAATVMVVENDFFAQPDASGKFVIDGLPPGEYTVKAWMAFGDTKEKTVKIESNKKAKLDIALGGRTGSKKHTNKDGLPYGPYK